MKFALQGKVVLMSKGAIASALVVASSLLLFGLPAAEAQGLPGEQFQKYIDSAVRVGAPGIVLHVETWDGATWSGAAGYAELESLQPITSDMPFRLHSLSMMPVAAVALALVDEAKLGLDDSIGEWIDPTLIENLPNAHAITIRDLIAHTSGIRDYFDEDFFYIVRQDSGREWRPEELIAHAINGPAVAVPGSDVSYFSNTNYTLLGLAIEKAGGETLTRQLHTRIFEPLSMNATKSWEEVNEPSPVHGHFLMQRYRIDVSDMNPSMFWGGGGLVSTAADVAKMTRGIFEGKILSSPGRALMKESFRLLFDTEFEYGYGSIRFPSFDPAPIGHSGRGVGYGTLAAWWPETGLIVVVLTNLQNEAYLGVLKGVVHSLGG
jgi:D-alanyl-D-alanine carboxypeptidase